MPRSFLVAIASLFVLAPRAAAQSLDLETATAHAVDPAEATALRGELASIDAESAWATGLYVAAPALGLVSSGMIVFGGSGSDGAWVNLGAIVLFSVAGVLGVTAIGLDVDSGSRREAWQRRAGLFDDAMWRRAAELRSIDAERDGALVAYVASTALGALGAAVGIGGATMPHPLSSAVDSTSVLFLGVGLAGCGAVGMAIAIGLDLDSGSRRRAWSAGADADGGPVVRIGGGPGDGGVALSVEL